MEFSTINNSSQEPMEAETDEECVPSNPALDFDTSHTDREEAVKESNAPMTIIVLHTHCGIKGNKLERRQEWEREARENESELQKLEVRIIIASKRSF